MVLKRSTISDVLSVGEMRQADQLAIESGVLGIDLMENAGRLAFEAIEETFAKSRTLVLCGPGNNGGDGFVVARLLEAAGWDVAVSLLTAPNALKGDAQLAYEAWIASAKSPVLAPFGLESLDGHTLIVDAVFGAGLARDVEGVVADIINEVAHRQIPVASIDVPTGVDGNTGQVRGVSFKADLSITFFRKKPGHLLLPGRMLCGKIILVDIGIPSSCLEEMDLQTGENLLGQWLEVFCEPALDGHKYSRGHTLVVSGGAARTGAARLAAAAALRVGSGLVSVASPSSAVLVNASHLTAVMVKGFSDFAAFKELIADKRLNSFVIGPGNGVGGRTRERVQYLLSLGRSVVLDADALTSFDSDPAALLEGLRGNCVLTPHGGEFSRLFPELDQPDKLAAAREASAKAGCVIVLKGADTVIAAPDGRALINSNAPPTLGTAGSGDVLAGLIGGLQAQGMSSFDAASAGVWIHGEAANLFGPGLIAEDLPKMIPAVLKAIEKTRRADEPC
jgi:ADP-dependent NAD(P)H-hydrate dehydratase / NAD(P)H-hydrate epimerase